MTTVTLNITRDIPCSTNTSMTYSNQLILKPQISSARVVADVNLERRDQKACAVPLLYYYKHILIGNEALRVPSQSPVFWGIIIH